MECGKSSLVFIYLSQELWLTHSYILYLILTTTFDILSSYCRDGERAPGWLSVEYATLDLRAISSSPMLGVVITYKKQNHKKNGEAEANKVEVFLPNVVMHN